MLAQTRGATSGKKAPPSQKSKREPKVLAEEVRLYAGSKLSSCLEIHFSRGKGIEVPWLGNQDHSSPCPLSFGVMQSWQLPVFHWVLKSGLYGDFLSVTDDARSVCRFHYGGAVKASHNEVRLSVMSLLKY